MFELVVLLVVVVLLRRPKPPAKAPHGKPDPAALAQLLRRRLSLADAVDEDLQRRRRVIEGS